MGEETFTPLEKLLTQGKELGYEGEELRKFVESQQKAERDESLCSPDVKPHVDV